jgi:hypothetical protein
MKKAFKASRLMGLFALALGLMAFSATAAQAEPGAHWNVNGSEYKSPLSVELQATLENNHSVLLTKVGLSKVEILCEKIEFRDALLQELGRVLGRIHFDKCKTKLNGSVAAACVPHSPGASNELILTNFLLGLIKLHTPAVGSKVDLLELTPENEKGEPITVFVTLVLGKAAPEKNECAIGEKFDITGKAFLKDCLEEGLVEKTTHLAVEGPLSALLFGANPATIDGSANVFLTGAHSGMNWSGIAA